MEAGVGPVLKNSSPGPQDIIYLSFGTGLQVWAGKGAMLWTFDDCVLDVERRELRRADAPAAVEPQVFDLLVYLLRNRARVVTKDDLLQAVWQGRIVFGLGVGESHQRGAGGSRRQRRAARSYSYAATGRAFVSSAMSPRRAREPFPRSPASRRRFPCRTALARRAAVHGHQSGSAQQPLRRRNYRGPDHRAGPNSMAVRDRPEFRVRLQEPGRRRETDLARARRALCAGGQRPSLGPAHQDHRAAHRRDDRRASMGRALRQGRRRDIRRSGRDCPQRGAAVEPHLLAAEGRRAAFLSPADLGAWELVARAQSQLWRLTKPDYDGAIASLKQAVDEARILRRSGFPRLALVFAAHMGWVDKDESVPAARVSTPSAPSHSMTAIRGVTRRSAMRR